MKLIKDLNLQIQKYTKGYEIINASYRLGLVESKILSVLYSCLKDEDDKTLLYKVELKNFDFIYSNNNNSRIKSVVKNLSKLQLLLDSDLDYTAINFFSLIRYNKLDKTLDFQFNDYLRPYLYNLKRNFKSFNLSYVLDFKSEYSFRFYEILKQRELLVKFEIDLETLHFILNTPSSYKIYNNFKSRVLLPVLDDLKNYSDIFINLNDIVEIKDGKKVIALRFTIKKNEINSITNLNDFIHHIRKNYINVPLLFYPQTKGNIQVSEKGFLYVDNSRNKITKEKSLIMWEYLFTHKDNLLIDLSMFN